MSAEKSTGMSKVKSTTPTVKQFMSQVLFTLEDSMPLPEAAQFFASHKLTTVPVMSGGTEIMGVLTDFHLLRGLLKARQDSSIKILADIREELDPVVTVHEDDSIVSAFRLMIQSPNHRLYATHGDRLVGALSPKDLLLYMAGIKDKNDQVLDAVVQRQIEMILRELNDTRRLLSDYQQMFHDSPYLMHSVDMKGKIVAANRMIHFVLGYEDGELIGKTMQDIYPPENYLKAMQGLETVRKTGFHPMVNVTMLKKDGEPIRVDVASTVRKDDQGNADATITVGRISDSYRMLNFLQRAAQAAIRRVRKSS